MSTPSSPVGVVDLGIFEANLQRMADTARHHGRALRPHAKTHRSLAAARAQLDSGAVGLTVATLQEADYFTRGGVDDVFIAYPLWVEGADRALLGQIASRSAVRVGVDSPEAAANLVGLPLEVMIEIDSGMHRSGVAPDAAGPLAATCLDLGLSVAGVFTFPGHSYRPQGRADAAADEASALKRSAVSLRDNGVRTPLRSGGCTPTAALTEGGVDEIRPGVYPFNDAQQWELGTCGPQDIAYTVHARVVSARPGTIVLDSGSKALGADRPPWTSGHGRLLDLPDARITGLSEHHAVVDLHGETGPGLGSIVRVVPNHVCTSMYLQPQLQVHRDGQMQEPWSTLR